MAVPIPDRPARARLRSPAEMAAALPYLVGFRPVESLVVVSLQGPRKRIGLTMRFDLPPPCHHDALAADVAVRLVTDGASHTVVACCTSAPDDDGGLPRVALMLQVAAEVEARDVAILDALLVRDGHWSSYLCDDVTCCPPDGTPIDNSPEIAAAHVLAGRALLPDREALVASIRPAELVARAVMTQAYAQARQELGARSAREGWDPIVDDAVGWVADLVERYADPHRRTLAVDEVARIAAAVEDLGVRDAVLGEAVGRDLAAHQALFIDLCRHVAAPYDAPLCTMLAWLAYASGNGSLANVALERAQLSDPAYSLAALLREGLHRQVPPSALRQATLFMRRRSRGAVRQSPRRG